MKLEEKERKGKNKITVLHIGALVMVWHEYFSTSFTLPLGPFPHSLLPLTECYLD